DSHHFSAESDRNQALRSVDVRFLVRAIPARLLYYLELLVLTGLESSRCDLPVLQPQSFLDGPAQDVREPLVYRDERPVHPAQRQGCGGLVEHQLEVNV